MCGSETWVLISEKRRLDRIRNAEIREELKQEGVLAKVQKSQGDELYP